MTVMAHDKLASPSADFGSVQAEFAGLISGCGVFNLSNRATISLTGSDRVRWLNGMVTNNVRDLPVGHGVYAFLLNPQGHILGDLYAFNRGQSLTLTSDRSQVEKLLATFDHYIIMDDVEVADITEQTAVVGIAGPEGRTILRAVGLELPPMEPLQFADTKACNIPLTIVRLDVPGVDCYEIWTAPHDHQQMWSALTNSEAKPVGASALEALRVAQGVPRYGQDIRERDLPQETGQARALNFNKGCYIGQEIVERIRSRGAVHRTFTGFDVEGPLPSPGEKIQSEGRDVGEITSPATLPLTSGERKVALGYTRREIATPGRTFQVRDTTLAIANLPFTGIFHS
jgi:folate-binding protein YgfZ